MSEERLFRTEAVVIKGSDLGEADRLLTLLTPRLGKIRAVAKGARKITSHLGGHVEVFTQVQVMIAHGRNLDYVTQVQTLNPFLEIHDSLDLLAHACYLAELVDQFAGENAENQPLYTLLVESLENLAGARDPDLLLRHFELHILRLSGYRPELNNCVACRRALEPVANTFSAAAGGILCPRCADSQTDRREVSVDLLKCLRYLQNNDYAAASRLRLPSNIRWELEALLGEVLRYTLERELKSADFLHELRRTARPTSMLNHERS